MANATKFTWVPPTTNKDGSALAPNEITAYDIGVRDAAAVGSVAGTYPVVTTVLGFTTTTEPLSNLAQVLKAGSYAAAIRSNSTVNSDWSTEVLFTIDASGSQPNAPTAFAVS